MPSVSRLLSWQPAPLEQAGQTLLRRAGDLQRCAADLTAIGSGLQAVWSGAAAQAATAHHRRRSSEVDELATTVHAAGQALLRAADAIAQARASLQSALAAASAAGCTVLDDGTVLPPARLPVPSGLTDQARTAWQTQADATAAAHAASAARLATQIRAALTAAGAADDTSSTALSTVQPPSISPPPHPVPMAPTGGQWGPVPLPTCPVTPPAASSSAAGGDDGGGFWSDLGHGVLDLAGLVPVIGEPADGINALWYGAQGDHLNASLSAAGMIPLAGWGATAAKVGIKGADAVRAGDEAAGARTSRTAGSTGAGAGGPRSGTGGGAGDVPGSGAGGMPPAGRRFVTTPRGTSFDVPADWVSREADNGKGIVVQRPGALGDADSIRIMEPTARYANGYYVHYNSHGQPLTVLGKPGGRQDTHIPEDFVGRVEGWPQ